MTAAASSAHRVRHLRLRNQRLSAGQFPNPQQVVRWLGAVQAQEYADAKWGLALRMRKTTDAAVERALSAGKILRTHILRPTWHFVAPEDIRWMLALTGPRIGKRMAPYNRHLELDEAVFRRSRRAIIKALQGGRELSRQELKQKLQRAGIRVDGVQRLAHLVMQAEIEGVICSGVRRGREHTYALLDERVPPSPTMSRDEAVTELARRYFRSHGPAQIQDFVWWSGLTTADARAGLAMVDRELVREVVDGKTFWFAEGVGSRGRPSPACLLPLYDEYLIAYKDRSASLDPGRWSRDVPRDPFSAPILVDGRVVGGWKKSLTPDAVTVTLTPFETIDRKTKSAVAEAARTYADFLGLRLTPC